MGYCPHCGNPIESNGAFCPHCGKPLKKKAPPYKAIIAIAAVLTVITAAVLLLSGWLGKGFSEDPDAMDKASASVVTVYTYDINDINIGSGSGFAAFETGIIVTNHHVIEGDTYRIEIVAETGDSFTADSIICYSEEHDIAILRVPECRLSPLPLSSKVPDKGEKVTAIGSPQGIQNTFSVGIFSNRTSDFGQDLLMSTAAISPGSSGGALFNEKGEVIGITSASLVSGNDLYFAVPIATVEALYDSRTIDDELSVQAFWGLTDHIYTADYVLANARMLAGQTVEVCGYLSAKDYCGYLVSSQDLVLWLNTYAEGLTEEDKEMMRDAINIQNHAGISLMLEIPVGMHPDEDLIPGAYCTLTGKVMVFTENNRGTEIRFIVEDGTYYY